MTTEDALFQLPSKQDDGGVSRPAVGTEHRLTMVAVANHLVRDLNLCNICTVLDPEKGVCADPVGRVAILGIEGLGPPGGVSECQLDPDRGGGKT